MVSNCFSPRIFLSRLAIAATAFALVALPGAAQAQTASSSPGYSSSSDWQAALAKLDMPAAPSAKASAQYGQYGRRNNRRYPYYNSNWSHFAFEIGAGPTAPIGNASRDWETWGYNVNVGAGWNFSRYFGALIEYQFNRMKIPGHTLTALAIDNARVAVAVQSGPVRRWTADLDGLDAGFRLRPGQVDMQQAVIQPGALHLDPFGEHEGPLKLPCGDPTM